MVAFPYRMGAGFPGDVNRTHPASILPNLVDATTPPTAYGQGVVVDAASGGVRPIGAGDGALTEIFGVTVRPYPFQQSAATNYGAIGFGSDTPSTAQPIDVLRAGYITVSVVGSPVKGGAVFIWYAASAGAHIQGGFEASATGGSTIALDTSKYFFNNSPDADGNVELGIVL